jgi:CBS domain containing-hemolysin-like protein
MSEPVAILVALALLAGNAFFVGAEFALISARRTQIEPLAAEGSRRARVTLRAMERVSLMMAGAQLGITACSLGLGAVGEPAVAHLVERPFAALGMPEQLLHPVAFVIALAIVVFLHMVLGEMVPKNIAIAGPERAALWLGPPLAGIVVVLKPVIAALNAVSNAVLRLVKVEPQDEVNSTFSTEEVAGLIAESRREGLLDADEERLLTGALEFEERTVSRVLLPCDRLSVLPVDATPQQVQEATARTGYSRFPIVDGDGGLAGYLHVKDALGRGSTRAADLARPLPRVAAGDTLRSALGVMQAEGAHLAAVTGPDGAVAGVVALEDLLEELVGRVEDAATSGRQLDQRRASNTA